MEKKLKAIKTATFTQGQALADIIQGKSYLANIEEEYFINEFNETIYLPKEKFEEYFSLVKTSDARLKANLKYRKSGAVVQFNITLTRSTENDIIEHLEKIGLPKATYVKALIRQDIAKGE